MMNNIRHVAFRSANAMLQNVGLRILRKTDDFDCRVIDPWLVDRMISNLAAAANEFLGTQSLFSAKITNLLDDISYFYEQYLVSSFRDQLGGSRFNNLLWLYLITKSYAPTVIVDSGTYRGASAWAMSLGAPQTKLYSFDIDLSQLRQRVNAEYIEADWRSRRFTDDLSRGLCYFDDHVDQARRLLEAAEVGFPLAIFDDDFPITSFAEMAHDGASLPKIEFVLDEALRHQTRVEWISRGKLKSWIVDRDYLDRARAVIEDTARLPDTSLITGIQQTPYRLVKLRRPS